jgi:MFS family permease
MCDRATARKLHTMQIARQYPRFGRLLAALAASQLGDWLYNLALLAYVEQRTHSTTWLGLTTAARIAPMVIGGPLGGLLADRLDRRVTMIASDVIRAALMGALVLTALATLPIILVPLLAAATTTAGVAYPSTVAAVTPRLVASEDLAKANGARGTIGPACVAAGPALGAVLLLIGPPSVAFAINAFTFIVSGLFVASIPAGPEFAAPARGENPDETVASVIQDLRAGARTLLRTPEAGWMVSADTAGSLVYGSQTVLLLAIANRLGLHAAGYGYLLAAQGLGGIAGATLAGRLGAAAEKRSTLAVALLMVGGPLPFLAFTHSVVVAIVLGLIAGMGAVIAEVVADTRLQQTLDEAHLGTAYGFAFAASVGGIAVGALIAPLLVSLLDVSGALLAIAAAVLALAATLATRTTTRTTLATPAMLPANA